MMKCNQRDDDAIDIDYQNENYRNFKNNFKFEKNKLNNKFERHNDDAATRDDDKFDDFYNNLKLFKKSKNKIDDKRFNCFIYKKSKH